MKAFPVNSSRFDPYKTFRFLVYFGDSPEPVAGVSKVSGLKRTTAKIEHKQGGDALTRKGIGRTEYDAITIERGVAQWTECEDWANAAQVLDKGVPSSSLKNLRRHVRIELLNEQGLPVHRYIVHSAWVSEFQIISDLDAGANAVAIEHIKLEHEGWEHDRTLQEPKEI